MKAVTRSELQEVEINLKGSKNKLLEKYIEKRNGADRISKASYESRIASNIKCDSRSFFRCVRCKQKVKDRIRLLKNGKEETVESLEETANLLNGYFSSVFTKERLDNTPEPARRIKEEEVKLDVIEFTKEDVIKQPEKLQVDKCTGVDGIHQKLLYETRIEIGEANLFKKFINSGELPMDWKDAVVVPLFKKGCRSSPGNYRSVSLTSMADAI